MGRPLGRPFLFRDAAANSGEVAASAKDLSISFRIAPSFPKIVAQAAQAIQTNCAVPLLACGPRLGSGGRRHLYFE